MTWPSSPPLGPALRRRTCCARTHRRCCAPDPEAASAQLASGEANRLLVLADATDSKWHATLDGIPLVRATAWGWAQAFTLPASGGQLEISYSQTSRQVSLGIQAFLFLSVLVLSAPGGRRGRGLEDDVDDEEDDVPTSTSKRLAVTTL